MLLFVTSDTSRWVLLPLRRCSVSWPFFMLSEVSSIELICVPPRSIILICSSESALIDIWSWNVRADLFSSAGYILSDCISGVCSSKDCLYRPYTEQTRRHSGVIRDYSTVQFWMFCNVNNLYLLSAWKTWWNRVWSGKEVLTPIIYKCSKYKRKAETEHALVIYLSLYLSSVGSDLKVNCFLTLRKSPSDINRVEKLL